MKKSDLVKIIANAKDDDDINSLLKGSDIETEFAGPGLTVEAVKERIKTDRDLKAFMDSENDKYHSKALETWKKNNLEKELDPFIKEKYPELITDPTQKKLLELEKELEKEKAANARKDLLAKALEYAKEKKIPAKIVEMCLDEDLDKTKVAIDDLDKDWTAGIEAVTTEKLKESSYIPGGTDPNGNKISIGETMAASLNKTNSAPDDPWSK